MLERKKIAILSGFPVWLVNKELPALPGHYPVWLLPLYEEFERFTSQYEIHWVVLHKGISKNQFFIQRSQYFHVISATKATIGLYTAYVHDRIKLFLTLKKIIPDLIHTWGTEYCYGLAGKDFRKRAKWLHTVQGLLKTYMKLGPMSRFQCLHSLYEPAVLKSAPYMTTESPWAAEKVKEIAPHIQPCIWDYAVESVFLQNKRKLSKEPTCLYCGSDSLIKNIDTIIAAFRRPELAHVRLVLAGPNNEKYNHIAPNITAIGRASREQVTALMSESWLLVHPSLADTGPTVVKEARAMGLPVILSTHCGSKQYIEHGKSGYIIEPNDVDALVEGVLKLTESSEQNLAMGAYNQKKCRKALSADTMCQGILSLYNSILEG